MNVFRNNLSPVRRNVARKSTSHRPLKNNLISDEVVGSFETNTDKYFEEFSRYGLTLNRKCTEKNSSFNNVSESVLNNTYCNELSWKSPDTQKLANGINKGGKKCTKPLGSSNFFPLGSRVVEQSETSEIDGVFTTSSCMLSYLQDSVLSPTVSQDSSNDVIDPKLVLNYPGEHDNLDYIKQSNKRNGFSTSPTKKCDKDGEPMLLRIKSSECNGKDKSETGESDIVVIVGNRMIQQCELVTATVHNDQSKDVPVKMIVCHTLSESCDQGDISQDDHTYEDDPVDSNFLKVLCVQTLADSTLENLEGEHPEVPIDTKDETLPETSSLLPTNIKSKKRKSQTPKVFFGARKKKKKSTDKSPENSLLQKCSSSSEASFENLSEKVGERKVSATDQDPESTSDESIITKRITRSSSQLDVGKGAVCKVPVFKDDAHVTDNNCAVESLKAIKKEGADVEENISAVKSKATKKEEADAKYNKSLKSSKIIKKKEADVKGNKSSLKSVNTPKKDEVDIKENNSDVRFSKVTKKGEANVEENISSSKATKKYEVVKENTPAAKLSKAINKEEADVEENLPTVKLSKATEKEEFSVEENMPAVKPSKAIRAEDSAVEENISVLRSLNSSKSKPDIKQVAATKGIMLLSDSNKEVAVIQQGSTVINDKDALLKLNPSKVDDDTLSGEVEETDVDIQQSLTEEILLEQAMRLARLRTSPRRKPILTKYEERRLVKSILDSLPQKKNKRITRSSPKASKIEETGKHEPITEEKITQEEDRTNITEYVSEKDSTEDSSIIGDDKAAKSTAHPPKRRKKKTTLNKKKKYKKESFEKNKEEIVEEKTITNVAVTEEKISDAIQCNIVESTDQLSLDICDSLETDEAGSPAEQPPSSKEVPDTVDPKENEAKSPAQPDVPIPFISSSTEEEIMPQGLANCDRQTTPLSVSTGTYNTSIYNQSYSPSHVPQYNIPLSVPLLSSPLPTIKPSHLHQAPNRPLYVGIPFSAQCSVPFKAIDSTQNSPVAHQNMSPQAGFQSSSSRSEGSQVSHLVESPVRSDCSSDPIPTKTIHDVPLSILVRDPRLKRRSALLPTPLSTNPPSDQLSVHRALTGGLPVRSHSLFPLSSTPQNVIPFSNQSQLSVQIPSGRLPVQSYSMLPLPSNPRNVIPLPNQSQPSVQMPSGRLPVQSHSMLPLPSTQNVISLSNQPQQDVSMISGRFPLLNHSSFLNEGQPLMSPQQNNNPIANQSVDIRPQDVILNDKIPLPLMSLPVEIPPALKNRLPETIQVETDDLKKVEDEFKGKYISPERRKVKKKIDDDPELQYKTPLSDLHDLPERTSSYSRSVTKKSASICDSKVRDYKSPRRKESTDTSESLSEEAIQSEPLEMPSDELPSSWTSAHYPILGKLNEMRRPEGNETHTYENENRKMKEYSGHCKSVYPPAYLRSQDFQQSAVTRSKDPARSALVLSEQFLYEKRRSGDHSNEHIRPEDYKRYSDHRREAHAQRDDISRKEEYRKPDEYVSSYKRTEEHPLNWSREYSPEGRRRSDERARDSRWSENYSSDYRRSKEYSLDTRREVRDPEDRVLQEMSRTEEESYVRKRERTSEDSTYPRYDYAHKRIEGRFPAEASCWKDTERERYKRSDRQYDSESRESRWDEDSDVRDLIDGPLTYYRRKQRSSWSWKAGPEELFERRDRSEEEEGHHKSRKRFSFKNYRDRYLREPSPSSLESPMSPEPEFVPYQEPIICLSTPQ